MENAIDNKKIKYVWQDKKFSRDTISNINHTNINNNINITNYYPSPSQEYVNKETFTFINENGSVQNVMSYPIKTTTHKTKKIKDSSPTPPPLDKKYHQCQSPYMKKILPSSKRQKSEDGNRIVNIYKNSPSFKYLKSNKKKPIKNDFYKENNNNNRKIETQNNITNKPIIRDNYYLDLSGDDINNKYKSNRNYKHYNSNNNNNQDKNKNKYINSNSHNQLLYNINKSVISYESNGNESLFNILDKPYQISTMKKDTLYQISSNDKNNNLLTYNFNSPKFVKSQKNINFNNNYKKEMPVEQKLNHYIILMQSVIRGYLLRIKLVQYLNLYERIKKAVSIIQYIFFQKIRFSLYLILNSNINKKLSKYYNMYSNITPTNNISLEFQKLNLKNNKSQFDMIKDKNKYQLKNNNETAEIQKELNKKKIDLAVAEKRIKELLLENKKVHTINNIIVRDNKQLALKLKNSENHRFNKLKSQNSNFYIINLKKDRKIKIDKLLTKIITKKIILTRGILYKYFYKFNLKTKLIYINEITKINDKNNNKNFIIENNNFIINENIIENNIINYNEIKETNEIKKINETNNINNINVIKKQKLKYIINKKKINLYNYRNIFEKWMMRSLIFKNKEFVKEKKKKKKEKFKQRKQKRLYGNCLDKNDKKNEEENENENSGDSDDFEGELKYSNKSGSTKKNNYY